MLVTFDLLTSVQFPSNPCLIRPIPWFLRQYFSSVFHCSGNVHGWVSIDCLCLWPRREHTQCENDGGGRVGSCRWRKILRGCVRKIILVCDLLLQDKAWYHVPVRLPVPKETGEASSVYHVGLLPHDRDWNPSVEPSKYVWKGLLEFFRHKLTQICEYDKGLLTKNVIHWEEKRRKMFPLFLEMIAMIIFLLILPKSQELINWILLVGVRAWVSKSEVDYGVSLDFP